MEFFIWLEGSRLGTWINQSSSVAGYPGILLIHTFGLTLLVGINVVISLRILGFAPQVRVVEMQKLFPLMWSGMVLSVTSGALLLTAKATTMIDNPAFFIKMLAIVLAISVFFPLRRKVFRDPLIEERPVQMNEKMLAVASLALWLIALTAGRLMAYVGEAEKFGALILK
jgi:hypothetical protein